MNSETSTPVRKKSYVFTFVLGIGGFLLFGMLTLVLFFSVKDDLVDYDLQRSKARTVLLQELRKEAAKELRTVAWVNEEQKIARMPLEQAMQLTVARLSKKPILATNVEVVLLPVAGAPGTPLAAAIEEAAPATAPEAGVEGEVPAAEATPAQSGAEPENVPATEIAPTDSEVVPAPEPSPASPSASLLDWGNESLFAGLGSERDVKFSGEIGSDANR